jgi:beta-ribofuranosylaminobenzene 5'-phosphate synthase
VGTRVSACARLHFGLFNLSGVGGKIDGGAGISIMDPACVVSVRECRPDISRYEPADPIAVAAGRMLGIFKTKFGLPDCLIKIERVIPEHVGLGSKTACLMSLGRALSSQFDLGLDYIDIAGLVRRGGTSGVGIHASEFGGIVVDNGHAYPAEKQDFLPSSAAVAWPPPLRERRSAPAGCVVVHLRLDRQGLSGELEKQFFQRSCPIPADETERLLDMVDQVLVPGIIAASLEQINDGLDRLQRLGMKAREWQIQGKRTKLLRAYWEKRRRRVPSLPPLCLSSMGPTVFLLSDDPERMSSELMQLGVEQSQIAVTAPARTGSVVTRTHEP